MFRSSARRAIVTPARALCSGRVSGYYGALSKEQPYFSALSPAMQPPGLRGMLSTTKPISPGSCPTYKNIGLYPDTPPQPLRAPTFLRDSNFRAGVQTFDQCQQRAFGPARTRIIDTPLNPKPQTLPGIFPFNASYSKFPIFTISSTGSAETPEKVAPKPSTLSPQPSTLNPQPSTLNPQPSTLNPQPSTLNPLPSTLNPQPSTQDF